MGAAIVLAIAGPANASDLDEAALYGALNRILAFNLELMELSRLPA